MTQTPATNPQEEINIRQTVKTIAQYSPLIVGVTLTLGLGSYLLANRIPPTYRSTGTVMSVASQAGENSLINSVLISAPPLPEGVVEKALHSVQLTNDIWRRLESAGLSSTLLAHVKSDMAEELATNRFRRIKVTSNVDFNQRGTYEFSANAESTEAAQKIAQAAMEAILAWDKGRAQASVTLAKQTYQAQLTDLDRQINLTSGVNRDSLVTRRGDIQDSIRQATLLENAATGTLQRVADPVVPINPVAPNKARSAIVGSLIGLLMSLIAVGLLDLMRRRINDADDLEILDRPVLGQLPRLKASEFRNGIVKAASGGGVLYESLGFLRVNLMTRTEGHAGPKRFLVTSTRPGEGKSTVTASLAVSLSSSGLRVLIIDADLHRSTQDKVWRLGELNPGMLQLGNALHDQPGAQPVRVAEHINLIPAGRPSRDASRILSRAVLGKQLPAWQQGYDVVLIDTPPLLALADALNLATDMDGVIMVVESGQTHLNEVKRALKIAQNAGVTVLGFVLNKVAPKHSTYAYYSYSSREASDS